MKQRLNNLLKDKFNLALIFILGISVFVNFYKLNQTMEFFADVGWFYISARDMILTHTIPLVGITSSHTWIHQGALWTYLLAGIMALTKFNPLAPAYITAALGILSALLIYFLTKEMVGKKPALIASFIYTTSPLAIMNNRLPYHTAPIPIFTVLLIYSTYRWIKGDKRFFPISFFLIGVLYNLEIATFSLAGTFILILIYGLIRKTKWAKSILNIKSITYSAVAITIPMIPMILYDVHHGFPQTLKFIAWIIYRIAVIFGYPTLHNNPPGETWHTFTIYNLSVLKDVLFLGSSAVALIILLATLTICARSVYKDYKDKKEDYGKTLLFIFFIFPTFAFITQKTNSGAYLLMLYPQMIILIGICVMSFKNKTVTVFLVASVIIIGLLNINLLLKHNYFSFIPYSMRLQNAQQIIKMSGGKPYNIFARGQGSQYKSFITPYKYLVWYLGYPASEKSEKLKFYVSEYPGRIKLETK